MEDDWINQGIARVFYASVKWIIFIFSLSILANCVTTCTDTNPGEMKNWVTIERKKK
jgi:hypothetical protein